MDEQSTNSTRPREDPLPTSEHPSEGCEPLAEAPELPLDPPAYTPREPAETPEHRAEAPELPQKTNLLSLPEISYTDAGNDAEAAVDDPELQEKLKNIDDHMTWNIWICFFSCGLIALFSNVFAFSWLLSLVGIYKSHKCQGAKKSGLLEQALLYSSEAQHWFYLSFMVGVGACLVLGLSYFHTLPRVSSPAETDWESEEDYMY